MRRRLSLKLTWEPPLHLEVRGPNPSSFPHNSLVPWTPIRGTTVTEHSLSTPLLDFLPFLLLWQFYLRIWNRVLRFSTIDKI